MLPTTYSFAMEDSIYDIFPIGEFILKDETGVLQEYMFTVEGAKYELSIGYEDSTIKNQYIVKDDSLDESTSAGLLNGKVKVNLIHDFKDLQTIESKHYNDPISNIVKKEIGKYKFTKLNIDDTGNKGDWYKLLKTQTDFINDNLLPFAFSNTADKSPYFYFIDNKNQYNFKNFHSMINLQKPYQLTLTSGTIGGSTKDSILSIKRLRKGLDITYNLRHRKIFSFSQDSGELIESEDYIQDYPRNTKDIPIVGDKSNITSFYLLDDDVSGDTFNKENLKGLMNNSMRDSMTLDRLVLTCPFNPNLYCGIPVEIIIPSAEDSSSNDFNLTGVYLIEKSIVVWDCDNQMAYTYCVVGRKSTYLPSSLYKMKERLINNG